MTFFEWRWVGCRQAGIALSVLLWALFSSAVFAQPQRTVVSALIVDRVNIFSADDAAANPAYRLINRLHHTTRQKTIVRELGVEPGDSLNEQDVEALERNLRKLGLFASVSVQLETEGPSAGTLVVNTRDRFSIVAGADGSFVGGVGEVGVTVGERNLRGTGDSVLLGVRRNTADELRGVLTYSDLHWLGAGQTARYRLGATEEGKFIQLNFSQPFKTESDTTGWSALFESVEQEIDYYEAGQSIAQIPEHRTVVSGTRTWRHVNASGTRSLGLSFLLGSYSYDAVQGSQADSYARPLDHRTLSTTTIHGWHSRPSYRKVTGLDTLRYVQDLQFGRSGQLRFGGKLKRVAAGNTTLRPVVSGSVTDSRALKKNAYRKVFASFASELAGQRVATTSNVGLKYYKQFSPAVTFAARMDYRHADNREVLPVQFTLGESSGLRGYANRLLSGNQLLRLNLEQRIDLQRKIGFLDVGLVGFIDVGWVSPESDPLRRSAGVGVRLGSTALLERAVIRIDVAYPFDADDAAPVYSAVVGQVFSF